MLAILALISAIFRACRNLRLSRIASMMLFEIATIRVALIFIDLPPHPSSCPRLEVAHN
jgi:hypothetical protein